MIPPICLGRVPVECAAPPRPVPAPRNGFGVAAPTPRTRPPAPPRQGSIRVPLASAGRGHLRHRAKGLTREAPARGPGPARTRGSPPPPRRSDLRAAILGEKGPAHVMRDQRNRIHLSSRDASPARHNPPALALREPASHNAGPGDMTNSTPPGGAPARSIAARGGARTGPGAVVPAQGLRAPARRTCPMLAK